MKKKNYITPTSVAICLSLQELVCVSLAGDQADPSKAVEAAQRNLEEEEEWGDLWN